MKRHNQPDEDETPESLHQTKTRRISPAGRRVSDEEGSGDLDLNATPLGFDLNAPVEEEETLQANSEWEGARQDVESKPDVAEVARINALPLEDISCDQPKAENMPLVGHDCVQAVVKSEEVYEPGQPTPDEDVVGLSSKEEEGSDQGESPSVKAEEVEELEERPQVIVHAIFCRPFEPLNITTSADEELEILRSVWSAWQQEDAEALDMTLAESLEELGKHALSPNRYLLLTSMYVSKRLPEAFCLPRTFKALLSFLESAAAQTVVKRQSLLPILACKLLFRAFAGAPDWPIEFVQLNSRHGPLPAMDTQRLGLFICWMLRGHVLGLIMKDVRSSFLTCLRPFPTQCLMFLWSLRTPPGQNLQNKGELIILFLIILLFAVMIPALEREFIFFQDPWPRLCFRICGLVLSAKLPSKCAQIPVYVIHGSRVFTGDH